MKRISFQKKVLDTRFSGRARLKERKEKGEWTLPFGQKSSSSLSNVMDVSDRIMCLRAPVSCGRFITVTSVYAPTLGSNQRSIISIPNADKILILGDFNARVGSDH